MAPSLGVLLTLATVAGASVLRLPVEKRAESTMRRAKAGTNVIGASLPPLGDIDTFAGA